MNKVINFRITTRHLFLTLLFSIAFLERIYYDLGPNIELLTSAIILSSFYLGRKDSLLLTLSVIILSDLIIGNSNIFIFTWTGFLVPALFASFFIKKLSTKIHSPTPLFPMLATGVSSNLFFFFWTNFGVWLLDSWEMYPNNLQGLLLSYVNALPFLRNQITSSLVFITSGYFLKESAILVSKSLTNTKVENNTLTKTKECV